MHPVIQRLLAKKTELYGRRHFVTSLLVNFIFTAIWTALTISLPGPQEVESMKRVQFYEPISEYIWRVILEVIGLLMALYFVLKVGVSFVVVLLYSILILPLSSFVFATPLAPLPPISLN